MAIITGIGRIIAIVIVVVVIICLVSNFIMVLSGAASYFDARGSELRIKAKTQYTSELIAQILAMVDFEIEHFIAQPNNVERVIELMSVYNQIDKISVEIYDGVEKDFTDSKFMFSEDYLMKFITNAVSKRMIEKCMVHNEESKS